MISKIEYQQGWKTDPKSMYKWNPNTQVAEKRRNAKSKFKVVSAIPRGLELRTGKMSEERIIKISVERAFKEISSLPESQRSWALAHCIFASCGVEYIKNDKGGVISLDGVKHYPAGKIADEVNLPNMEQLIGSTYRKPRKREEAELEQIRAERRKSLDAQAHPLPPVFDVGKAQVGLHDCVRISPRKMAASGTTP